MECVESLMLLML